MRNFIFFFISALWTILLCYVPSPWRLPNFQHLQLVVPLGNKSLVENAPLREVETMAKDNLQDKIPLNHKYIALCLHMYVSADGMRSSWSGSVTVLSVSLHEAATPAAVLKSLCAQGEGEGG
jgi:hypothetical protein